MKPHKSNQSQRPKMSCGASWPFASCVFSNHDVQHLKIFIVRTCKRISDLTYLSATLLGRAMGLTSETIFLQVQLSFMSTGNIQKNLPTLEEKVTFETKLCNRLIVTKMTMERQLAYSSQKSSSVTTGLLWSSRVVVGFFGYYPTTLLTDCWVTTLLIDYYGS